MKKNVIFFLVFITLASNIFPGLNEVKSKLIPEFKEWEKRVAYIITPEEKKVFQNLKTDRDRRIFISLFWNQRDPSPGTAENEFKDEMIRRYSHVNRVFGHGSPKPGWKTEMGEIYMILGAPESIDKVTNSNEINPVQIWFYRGKSHLNLPDYFNIVFFKAHGFGEWQVYSPVGDGPETLLRNSNPGGNQDYYQLYNKIKTISPQLANASISMIPGKRPHRFIPRPESSRVIANVYQSPQHLIEVKYATDFLNYKGRVRMSSSTRFIKSSFISHLFPDERSGLVFLNYTLEPKKLTLIYNKKREKYYFNINIMISINRGDTEIFHYSKDFETYIKETDIRQIRMKGVQISDFFPVVPGKFQMTVLVENKLTSEVSFLDQELIVPDKESKVRFLEPLVSYKKSALGSESFYAYQVNNHKLSVDPDKVFARGDRPKIFIRLSGISKELWSKGFVRTQLVGMRSGEQSGEQSDISLNEFPFQRFLSFPFKISNTDLPPDYYQLNLELFNGQGEKIDTGKAEFTLSPQMVIPEAVEVYTKIMTGNTYYFNYLFGLQYKNLNQLDLAEKYLKKAVLQNPAYIKTRVELINISLLRGKYEKILHDIESFRGNQEYEFFYHLMKGKALYGSKRFNLSLESLLQANLLNNSDYNLLNLIALNYLKLGERSKAEKAFRGSLNLNKNQPLLKGLFKKYQIHIEDH